jgi:hypothetical protein
VRPLTSARRLRYVRSVMATHDEAFFERFKWEILGDAAFEDIQGLWEPLWLLRGDLKRPEMSEAGRQQLAERALRELDREGLIYFFRVPPDRNPNDAAEDDSQRLAPDEVDAALSSAWWRGPGSLPVDHPNVWWSITPKGLSLAQNPPADVRGSWYTAD